jgi:hypothetical protein
MVFCAGAAEPPANGPIGGPPGIASVILRVMDRSGKPIPNVEIALFMAKEKKIEKTDGHGLATIQLTPEVKKVGFRTRWFWLSCKPPLNFTELRLPLDADKAFDESPRPFPVGDTLSDLLRAPGEKAVVVKDFAGKPIADATVTIDYESVEFPPKYKTDREGKATMEVGSFYRIKVESGGAEIYFYNWQRGKYAWPLELRLPVPPK